MNDQPKFCQLCGRSLRIIATANYLWWQCPKWPDRGEHWWSDPLQVRHDMLVIRDEASLTPKNFDRLTGNRIGS